MGTRSPNGVQLEVNLTGKRPGASTLLARPGEEPSAIFLIFRIPRGTKWWKNALHHETDSAIKAESGTSLEVTWKVMLETVVRVTCSVLLGG